jgi:hypothetical protein
MGEAVRPASAARRVHFEHRRSEDTVLYQLVQVHIETFLAQVELETGAGLPEFVKEEFEAFLEAGYLPTAFYIRLRCADCAHEKLVAFSGKRRAYPECRNMLSGGVLKGATTKGFEALAARAMDMAVARYTELYGKAPDAEIVKLAMVSDLEPDD